MDQEWTFEKRISWERVVGSGVETHHAGGMGCASSGLSL